MAIKRMGLGFSALVLTLSAVVLPVNGMAFAEGSADESTETAESTAVASVATYEEFKAALSNTEITTIKLTANIESSDLTWIQRGVVIDGQGYVLTSTATYALLINTAKPVVLKDLTVRDAASGSIALYFYNADFNTTLSNVALQSNKYGIYMNGNPSTGKLTIDGSKIEWINTDGNAVADATVDHSGTVAAYGIYSSNGFGSAEIELKNSSILGYRYNIISYGNVAGAKLTIEDSILAGWTNMHIYGAATEENPMTVKISGSKLYGTAKFSGSSNTYANLIIEKGTYTSGGKTYSYLAKYINLEVADSDIYAYAAKDSDMWASQYAVMNRARGEENTNTVKLSNTNFTVLGDFETQKAQNSNFQNEPTWASDEYEEKYANGEITYAEYIAYFNGKTAAEMRADRQLEDGSTKWIALTDWAEKWDSHEDDPVLSGITVESGIFAYNPKGFTAKGTAINKLKDGTYQVYMPTGYSSKDETTGKVTTYATLEAALESNAAEILVDKDTEVETLSVPEGKTLRERDGAVTVKNSAESEVDGKFVKQDGKSYHVIKTEEIENGSLEFKVKSGTAHGALVAAGSEVMLTTYPAEGYEMDSIYWSGDTEMGKDGSIVMPDEDVTVGAHFDKIDTATYKEAMASIVAGQSMSFEAPEDSKMNDWGIMYTAEGKDSVMYEGADLEFAYAGDGVWMATTTADLAAGSYVTSFYSESEDFWTSVYIIVGEDENEAAEDEALMTAAAALREYQDVMANQEATDEQKAEALKTLASYFDSEATALAVANADTNDQEISLELIKDAIDAEEVGEDVIEALSEKLADEGLGDYAENMTYYDLSFMVSVDGTEVGKLTQLDNAVQITLAVDNDAATGYTRKYIVVRYHDGTVEVLDSVYNEEDGTVTFESDKFSTYAVAYYDELSATPDTGRVTASQSAASGAAVVTMLASIIVLAGAAIFAKRTR